MRISLSPRRRTLWVGLICVSALALAALACDTTTTNSATAVPVVTRAGGSTGGSATQTTSPATQASTGATQASTEATQASSGSTGGKEINADNVDKLVELWNISVASSEVRAGAVSGSDHTVATFSRDRVVRLWDGDTGKKLKDLPKHADDGFGLSYSADGKVLASGAGFNVTLWDPVTGKKIKSITPDAYVFRMAFSPDSKMLAVAGGLSSKLDIIDVASGEKTIIGSPPGFDIWSVAYSGDGKMLATADSKGNLTVFDANSKAVLGSDSASGAAWDTEFSPDSKYVTTCNNNDAVDGGFTTWDTSSFTVYDALTQPKAQQGGCYDGVYSKNSDIYFSVGGDNVLNAWAVSSGRLLYSYTYSSLPWSVSISGDGQILAVTLTDGTLHILGVK